MSWKNQPLELYHGTDDWSAGNLLATGVNLAFCSPFTDFGSGFYATTNRDEAEHWARLRALNLRHGGTPNALASVIELQADRDWLGALESLVFVRPDTATGYPDFVQWCRGGNAPHRTQGDYAVVCGPVSNWVIGMSPQQKISTIADFDQFSFHAKNVVAKSSPLFSKARIAWTGPP